MPRSVIQPTEYTQNLLVPSHAAEAAKAGTLAYQCRAMYRSSGVRFKDMAVLSVSALPLRSLANLVL